MVYVYTTLSATHKMTHTKPILVSIVNSHMLTRGYCKMITPAKSTLTAPLFEGGGQMCPDSVRW